MDPNGCAPETRRTSTSWETVGKNQFCRGAQDSHLQQPLRVGGCQWHRICKQRGLELLECHWMCFVSGHDKLSGETLDGRGTDEEGETQRMRIIKLIYTCLQESAASIWEMQTREYLVVEGGTWKMEEHSTRNGGKGRKIKLPVHSPGKSGDRLEGNFHATLELLPNCFISNSTSLSLVTHQPP